MKLTFIIMLLFAGTVLTAPAWGLDVNAPQSVAAETILSYDKHERYWYLSGPNSLDIQYTAELLPMHELLYNACLYNYSIDGELAPQQKAWDLSILITVRCYQRTPVKKASLSLKYAWSAGTLLSFKGGLGPSGQNEDEKGRSFLYQVFTLRLPFETFLLWEKEGQGQIKLNHNHHARSSGIIVTVHGNYIDSIWSGLQKQLPYHKKQGSGPG